MSYWLTKICMSKQQLSRIYWQYGIHCCRDQWDMWWLLVGLADTLVNEQPVKLHLPQQGCADEDVSKGRGPETRKQRTECWSLQCDGAKIITGVYPFSALGLGKLKEQHTHYNKVYNGEREVESPDLQVRFDYGSANKSHALQTTLGKIIPFFLSGGNIQWIWLHCTLWVRELYES